MTSAVRLEYVSKRYKDVQAVKDVSLEARNGEVLGLVGPSGAGKSTLLRIIDLLEAPDSGKLYLNDKPVGQTSSEVSKARSAIGMVLQKPAVLNRSVRNNLAYSLSIRGVEEKEIATLVREGLRKYGLENRAGKNARTLSGGEMQRLCFARAVVFDPDVLLLDEFAANLDPANVSVLEGHLRQYANEGRDKCVIVVTHNLFQAKRLCDRVALMWNGEVVEVAEKAEFFESPKDSRTEAFVKGELVY